MNGPDRDDSAGRVIAEVYTAANGWQPHSRRGERLDPGTAMLLTAEGVTMIRYARPAGLAGWWRRVRTGSRFEDRDISVQRFLEQPHPDTVWDVFRSDADAATAEL